MEEVKKGVSKLALISFILSFAPFLLRWGYNSIIVQNGYDFILIWIIAYPLFPSLFVLSLILGLMSIKEMKNNPGLKGKFLAIIGISISALFIYIFLLIGYHEQFGFESSGSDFFLL